MYSAVCWFRSWAFVSRMRTPFKSSVSGVYQERVLGVRGVAG